MRQTSFTRAWLAGCSALAVMAGGASAAAQTEEEQSESAQSSQPRAIEEIVVRSLPLARSLQDAPAMISAFTEEDIQNVGIDNLRDFTKLIPNLFLVEVQNRSFSFINIRGITQTRNTESSVAIVVDGVLSTSPIGQTQELFDIERIEVLKGPQGALYGRNAMGGAIIIETQDPSNEFEGFVRGELGGGDLKKAQAMISGPLIEDELFARTSFSTFDDDGFRKNIVTGTNADAASNVSSRSRLIWEPTSRFHSDLRFTYSKDEGNNGGFIDVSPIFHEVQPGAGISLGQAVGVFPPGSPNFAAGPVVSGRPASDLFVPGQPANIGGANNDFVPLQTNLEGTERRDLYNVSFLNEYEADWATFRAVSSWDRLTDIAVTEQPPRTMVAAARNTQFKVSNAFSQDFRIQSPRNQRFQWMAGAYWVATESFLSLTTQRDFDGRDGFFDVVKRDPFAIEPGACNPSPFPIGGPTDNQGNCILGFQGDEQDNTAFAFYGLVSYDLTDTLNFEFSARWDRDERNQTVRTPNALFQIPEEFRGLQFGDKRSENFEDFQPKAVLRWTPGQDFTAWVTYAEGFRSGSFNRPGIGDLADFLRPTAQIPIQRGIRDVFPEQRTQGFESGVKWQGFNGRLNINAAGFWTDIDNMQTFSAVTLGTVLSQVVIPVQDVNVYGAELDVTYTVFNDPSGIGTLDAQANFGFTESRVAADPDRNLEGNDAPQTPKTTTNFNLQWNRPLEIGSVDGNVFLRAEYQRIGEVFFTVENFTQRDPLHLVNLRGGYELPDDWRIEGWVTNLGNENFFARIFNPGGFGFPGRLRQWGVEVTKRF